MKEVSEMVAYKLFEQDMRDKKEMYNSICDLINSSDFVNFIGTQEH